MSLKDTLTSLADSVRETANLNQKLSLADMTKEVGQMSSLNNYFLTKLPIFTDGKGHTSTAHGAAQRFTNQGGLTGELVQPSGDPIILSALKGDTITQSLVIKSDGTFKNLNFNFWTSEGNHPVLATATQLDSTTYKLSASYMVDADTEVRLMSFWADWKGGTYVELSQPYAAITKIGGVIAPSNIDNLLPHSATFEGWDYGKHVNVNDDSYLNGRIASLGGAGVTDGYVSVSTGLYVGQTVTWSVYAKAESAGDMLHTELWGGGGMRDIALTTDWKLYRFNSATVKEESNALYFWGVIGNKKNIDIALPYAVEGTTIGTWAPNPNDKTQ